MADGHKGRALQEDRNVRLIIKGSTGSQYKSDEVGTCQCREGLYALPKKNEPTAEKMSQPLTNAPTAEKYQELEN